jgi:ABC-type lipoprotein release transport system permease subunit
MRLTGIGLAGGLLATIPLVRLMRTLLYEVEPFDPLSIAAATVLLAAVAFGSTWRPAHRAMRVDPVTLLRED